MKLFDKMYVGFQRQRYLDSDEPRILGFVVPYGETKAHKKRIETVNRWANNKEDCRVIDNKPMRGFKLKEVVSRHSTSNKFFRVLDPRGFELELSTDNVLDLILNSTFVKGEIIEECIWTQNNGVYLVPTDSEKYKTLKNAVKKGSPTITTGKYYNSVNNVLSVFRFEGIFHGTSVDYKYIALDGHYERSSDSFYHSPRNLVIDKVEVISSIGINKKANPYYIYTEFLLDENGNVTNTQIHARKSHFKDLQEYNENLSSEVHETEFDPLYWIEKSHRRYNREEISLNITSMYSADNLAFFKQREDALNFDYNEIIKKHPKDYSYRVNIDNIHQQQSYYYQRYSVSPVAEQVLVIKDKRS